MIFSVCKFTGQPIVACSSFAGLVRISCEHPVLSASINQLEKLSANVKDLTKEETFIVSVAYLKATSLLESRGTPNFDGYQKHNAELLLKSAIQLHTDFHQLSNKLKKELPKFRIDSETSFLNFQSWARTTSSLASDYVKFGRVGKLQDESYLLDIHRLEKKVDNADYQLPQVYDRKVGLWAYESIEELMSLEAQAFKRTELQEIYKFLTLEKSTISVSAFELLREFAECAMNETTEVCKRNKILAMKFIDNEASRRAEAQANLLGEKVTTKVRTVAGKQWSVVVLDAEQDAKPAQKLPKLKPKNTQGTAGLSQAFRDKVLAKFKK